jgi:hypothetical protein
LSLEKHEYFNGEVFAMAGASCIVTNIIAELHGKLKNKSCKVLASDLRIKVEANSLLHTLT